jgi:hypothetical protein
VSGMIPWNSTSLYRERRKISLVRLSIDKLRQTRERDKQTLS